MNKKPSKPSEVKVKLSGKDGNVFVVIGLTMRALKQAGFPDAAVAYAASTKKCGSYDEVLRLTMKTVDVR